jgi:hypothetical protein
MSGIAKIFGINLRTNAAAGGFGTAWPVGAVFISVVSANPATLLGVGTWQSIGAGKVLIGLDSGDANFDTVEETGGSKTSTPDVHVGTAIGDHAVHNHAYGTIAVADHTSVSSKQGSSSGTVVTTKTHTVSGSVANNSAAQAHSITQPSQHAAMSVVQPYLVVYMWKRTG